MNKQPAVYPKELKQLDHLAKLMDSQFSIPGTNFRFGLDGLIGLIPGAGDVSTFMLSGYMIIIMARNGASGYVLARMATNVLIDAIIGSIPIIGDIFDMAFKANLRNMRLMHKYYTQGRYRGGAWKVIVPILLFLFIVIALIVWGIYRLLAWIF